MEARTAKMIQLNGSQTYQGTLLHDNWLKYSPAYVIFSRSSKYWLRHIYNEHVKSVPYKYITSNF
jgi:hypothetical protein